MSVLHIPAIDIMWHMRDFEMTFKGATNWPLQDSSLSLDNLH